MLADLDDPPRSRLPGLLLGVAIATPVTLAIGAYVLPQLHQLIIGGAETIDQQNEAKSAYMRAVCTESMILERDEELCICAMASDLAAIDCQFQFEKWTFLRQIEQCSESDNAIKALSFCTCVNALAEQYDGALANADDSSERREVIYRYQNCTSLDDALFLPQIENLNAIWNLQPAT